MNSRLLSIGIPVTAFVLTVAFQLWRQRSENLLPPGPPDAPPAATAGATPPPAETARQARVAPPAAAAVAPVDSALSAAAGSSMFTAVPGNQVPVRLAFHSRDGQPGLSAIMINMSEDDLDARVEAVNPTTHLRSVVDVSLHGHQRKTLTDAGLEVAEGSQVTVESPPYRAFVVQAQ
jgi:hypothetical protein